MASPSDVGDPAREKRQSRWGQQDESSLSSKKSDGHRRYIAEERKVERNSLRESPYGRKEEKPSSSRRFESSGALNGEKSGELHRKEDETAAEPPFKPNFKASGALAAAARTTASGVVLKFAAPAEARTPTLKWRLFPFKGEDALDPIPVHEKSVFLLGRDDQVCDVVLEHPSISGQHAAIVHRQVSQKDPETGLRSVAIKPFLIDLESRNGTLLNDVKIEDSRYYQLFEKDSIRFGSSTREYIILNEKSK
jgi:smad nuclear-interacting protein 1